MASKKVKKSNVQTGAIKASQSSPKATYVLHLFVAGATARSHQAVLGLNDLCNEKIKGGYKLKVFDIYQQPELAKKYQIVATPTLIKVSPHKVRRFIGILGIINGFSQELDLPEAY